MSANLSGIKESQRTSLRELESLYSNFSKSLLAMRRITTEGQLSIETARPRPQ